MKVVIVGGGVAGLSIGWRLARAKLNVIVLERAQPGRGATWAAGGMIAATAEHADWSSPEAHFARGAAARWPAFAAEIEQESQRKIFFRRDGSLIVPRSSEHFSALKAGAPAGVSLLSSVEAQQLEPMLRSDIPGAMLAPDDSQVDNRALGLALAFALVNAGGVLKTNEAVVRFEFDKGHVLGARTPFSLHEADAFVIAAGAWSGQIEGLPQEILPPVFPVKGEMLALEPPQKALLPTHLVWGDDVYLIPRHKRLFVGATVQNEGFDTSVTDAAANQLLSGARSLMPGLQEWRVVEQWAGLRPGSPDDSLILGETAVSGLYVASGQYRNGILFAPSVADALYSLVVEHRAPPEIEAFNPKRFRSSALVAGQTLH